MNRGHGIRREPPRFCPRCGNRLAEKLVPSDGRRRLVCVACGRTHYLNPRLVAATVTVSEGRAVLLTRAIEPRKGTWTIPGGFVEIDETVEEAARRETAEETGLEVALTSLLGVYSRPVAGIVTAVYLARIAGGTVLPGPEAQEVVSLHPHEIPWDNLAFESTERALRDWIRRSP